MINSLRWRTLLVVGIVAWAIWLAYPPQQKIKLGLDLKGGMHLILRVDIDKVPKEVRADATERAIEIIRNRIDQFGVSEPLIQRQGASDIVVQLPGITDSERAKQIIKQSAHLEFKLVSEDMDKINAALAGQVPLGYELKYLENKPLLLEEKAALGGDSLVDARVEWSSMQLTPAVSFSLNAQGARRFAYVTKNNIGKRLAIVLDGKLKSAPVIETEIPQGRGQITGRFSEDEAADLALVLRTGALPAPVEIKEERVVGPALGEDSIRSGVRSTILATILVFVFMAGYYFWAGLIANFALCLNLVIMLGVLAYPPLGATLTLPGIAGIALTLGMAVDANVLIFERIREELKLGRTMRMAITNGYHKAFSAIFDSNLTTVIAAIILFIFGTGPIKGFATTLTIGLIVSMFTAIVVTRLVFDLLPMGKRITEIPMLQFVSAPHFDFIGRRKIAYLISLIMIVIGLVSIGKRGKQGLGVDFGGGSLQEFRFAQAVSVEQVRKGLKEINLDNAVIQQDKDKRDILIRSAINTENTIINKLKADFPQNNFAILRVENVGPAVGKDLTARAIQALAISLVGMLIYMSIRFNFLFAVAGVIAIFHDVLVTAGLLSLAGREFSIPVIAALLTIVGYSINDTIVIYDRIRENSKLTKKLDYLQLINTSINQTLSRTLLTFFATFLSVLALFFLGGAVINDFAFVLLVGMISGTYSTVFVAAPILVDWRKQRK